MSGPLQYDRAKRNAAARRAARRAGEGDVIRHPEKEPTKRQVAAVARMARELGKPAPKVESREGASAAIEHLARQGATPPRAKPEAEQRLLSRERVLGFACERCRAAAGSPCVGLRGQERAAAHLERVKTASAQLRERPPP